MEVKEIPDGRSSVRQRPEPEVRQGALGIRPIKGQTRGSLGQSVRCLQQKVGLMGGACWANMACSDWKQRWGKRQAGSHMYPAVLPAILQMLAPASPGYLLVTQFQTSHPEPHN